MSRLVEFNGNRYWLVFDGEAVESGALAYLHHCDEKGDVKPECATETSFAHLYDNGEIKRFGEVIGTSADIKEVKQMASKVLTGDEADRWGHQRERESVTVFQVRYDHRRKQIVFLGTDMLTQLLSRGYPLEQYLTEKISQARKELVKEQ